MDYAHRAACHCGITREGRTISSRHLVRHSWSTLELVNSLSSRSLVAPRVFCSRSLPCRVTCNPALARSARAGLPWLYRVIPRWRVALLYIPAFARTVSVVQVAYDERAWSAYQQRAPVLVLRCLAISHFHQYGKSRESPTRSLPSTVPLRRYLRT